MVQAELELSEKRQSQKTRILNLLRQRGLEGVKNYEIRDLGILSHSKRLSELYADGHHIKKEYLGKGVHNYVLIPEHEFGEIS